jgi:hypothetical protein
MRRFQHLRKDFSASAPSISRQSSYKNDNVIPPENDDEPVVPESPERKLLRQLTRRLSIDLNEMDGESESTLEDGQRSKRFCEMMMGDFESSMNERDKILHALEDSLVTKDIGNPTNFEDELAEMLAEQAAVDDDDDDDEGIFDVVATEPHAAEDLNLDQKGPTIDPQAVDTMEMDRKNQEIEALEEELRQAREECRLAHQQVMSVEMSYQSEQRRNEALEREIRKLRQELASAKEAALQQSSLQLQQQEAAAAAERERQQQDEALQRSASARELANQQNDALAAALAELAKTKERLAQETLTNQQAEARHAADRAAREEATIKASQAAEAEARKQQAANAREGQSIPRRQLKHVGVETNASERAALEAMTSLQQQLDQLKKRAAELGVLQQQIASMEVVITQLSNLIRAMMKARYLVTYDERDLKIESQSPATLPSSPPLHHLPSSQARTPRRVASASPAHMKSAMTTMKTPPSPANRGKSDSLRDTLASMQRLCLENW